MRENITVEDVLFAYRIGYFPMAEPDDGKIYWHCPDPRAIFNIYKIKTPRYIKKMIKNMNLRFTINEDFEFVIRNCANRKETWISEEIIEVYTELHKMGFAHSIETWSENNIIGGLYGVAINGAFFGESMFNFVENASKAAFYFLVEWLKSRGFLLLDSQYINNFTRNLGAIEISKAEYLKLLGEALRLKCSFI